MGEAEREGSPGTLCRGRGEEGGLSRTDTGLDPVLDPVPGPALDPALDLVSDPLSDPVLDPVLDPVPDPVLDPALDSVLDPMPDPPLDPAPDPVCTLAGLTLGRIQCQIQYWIKAAFRSPVHESRTHAPWQD